MSFKSKEGIFKWLATSFGLTNSPTTFMRMMDDILWLFTNSLIYMDGILIFSKTQVDHLQHIQQVFSTLWKHKLYANLEKFSFGTQRIQYLGYIVDENGVHVDPTKIQIIWDWPASTTLTELHSFLDLVSFYRRFVVGLSSIAQPLIQVTKGGGKAIFFQSETIEGIRGSKPQPFLYTSPHLARLVTTI